MSMTMQAVIKGCTFFDGEIDGKEIKSGTVFIEDNLEQQTGRSKGTRTLEYPCVDAEVVKRIINNEFPISAEIELEMKVTKRDHKPIVVSVKPIVRVGGNPSVQKAAA